MNNKKNFKNTKTSITHGLWGSLLLSVWLGASTAQAYYTTNESAEVIPENTYSLGLTPEIVLNGNTGANLGGLIDYSLSKETSVRGFLGTGQTAFDAGGSFKWIPIPDYGKQPAAGGKIELETSTNNGNNQTAIRFHPLVSKRVATEYGSVVPYASLPVSFINASGNSTTGLQVVGGAEYQNPDYKKWNFSAELGINLNNATSYISGLVSYNFDVPSDSSKKSSKP